MDILSQLSATLPPKETKKNILDSVLENTPQLPKVSSVKNSKNKHNEELANLKIDEETLRQFEKEDEQFQKKLDKQMEEDEKLAKLLQEELAEEIKKENLKQIQSKSISNTDSKINDKTESNTDDDKDCVVCMEFEKCAFFVPCAHRCCCAKCAYEILEFKKVCPLCWTKLEGVNA